MKISNDLYDVLKWISCICIPAIIAFLSVVLGALNIDAETINVIVTVIGAVGTLIGALIGVSTYQYNKEKKDEDNNR